MKVAFFIEFTEVGFQLPCRGYVDRLFSPIFAELKQISKLNPKNPSILKNYGAIKAIFLYKTSNTQESGKSIGRCCLKIVGKKSLACELIHLSTPTECCFIGEISSTVILMSKILFRQGGKEVNITVAGNNFWGKTVCMC